VVSAPYLLFRPTRSRGQANRTENTTICLLGKESQPRIPGAHREKALCPRQVWSRKVKAKNRLNIFGRGPGSR
jgi:hypothetical protein